MMTSEEFDALCEEQRKDVHDTLNTIRDNNVRAAQQFYGMLMDYVERVQAGDYYPSEAEANFYRGRS